MQLEPTEKELAAIGASVGAGCRPCIEHHVAAARQAGISEPELAEAVATAFTVRSQATELFARRVRVLLGGTAPALEVPVGDGSQAAELVALGVDVGANSHALLRRHLAGALAAGLTESQVTAAVRMAELVQRHAAEMTADEAAVALATAKQRTERSTA
jgi:AhpD family alkylhydroperoxidase